jgi:alpha-amylase
MAALEGAGYIAVDPVNAVTFVDNPDTDLSPGENVIWNKLLGYALILTAEGYPCVYYKDYSTDPKCYGLKPFIDNLIWIHENLAFGQTLTRWGNDPQVYIFERQGHPGLLVGLNNDQEHGYTRTVQTSFGAHVQLHEYTGKHDDIWTDADGKATFAIPRNDNGRSYLCFSRTGYQQAFSLHRRTTTQTLFGAPDLDTGPVENGIKMQAGRISCDKASAISVQLESETNGWSANTEILIEIVDSQDKTVASKHYTNASKHDHLKTNADVSGWFTLRLSGRALPAPANYALTVTYTATQEPALR